MNERTPWIISTALLGGLCIGIALVPVSMSRQLDEQAPRLERRDQYCHQEKFEAETASDNLRSHDKNTRDWGLLQFKTLSLGGWRMANMCSPISVGDTCDDRDLPCQLAALDWVTVNIR
jgi:hypothetical protein